MAQLSPSQSAGTQVPTVIEAQEPAAAVSASADSGVGQPLTDEERERAIARAGALVLKRYGVWADAGCFAALGDAHRALDVMRKLIAGRSPEAVAAMERRLGLV